MGNQWSYAFVLLTVVMRAVLGATYDVVVIGSGPGGLVAAEYLSRNAGISVLVLEAGGPSLAVTGGKDVPAYAQGQGLTRFDIPGEYSNLAFQRDAKYRMGKDWIASPGSLWLGKVIGGSSSLNGMLYFHTPDSYVTEASWPYSASSVHQGFAAIEKVFGWTDLPSVDGKRYAQEAYRVLTDVLTSAGYKEATAMNADAWRNKKHQTFGHPPFTIQNGLRNSPAKTFLGAAKTRPNFKLISSATVSHIIQSKGTATGVVYTTSDGQTVTVNLSSRGAVVVAGSAAMTPKILLQSGVGPKAQLELLKNNGTFAGVSKDPTTWVLNENVGSSIFDTHQLLMTFSRKDMVAFQQSQSPADATKQYLLGNHSGPWAQSPPVLIGYENYQVGGRMYQFQVTTFTHGFAPGDGAKHVGVAIYLNNPISRDSGRFDKDGLYRINTAHSMYSDPRDRAALISFVDKFRKMMATKGAAAVVPTAAVSSTDFVNNKVEGANHYGGSCYTSIDKSDTKRCADETFRVVGANNIFVGDGSLMKEGTVNPYGFIMYSGYQAGVNVQASILSGPKPHGKNTPHMRLPRTFEAMHDNDTAA